MRVNLSPQIFGFVLMITSFAPAQQTAPPPPDPNSGVGPTLREEAIKPLEHRDITYLSIGGHDSQLDVFEQPGGRKSPVLIYFHGGGWWRNSRPASFKPFQAFLKMGFSIVNVDYRLTPVAPAPAAVQDARCALAWVKQNRRRYHFDDRRIVVYGTSAGGHLALMDGLLPIPSEVDLPQCRNLPKPAAVLDFYGIADVSELLDGPHVRTWANEWVGKGPDRVDIAHQMSPLTYVRQGLPPFFIVHGDADATVPYTQSVRLRDLLQKNNVSVQLYTVKDGPHGRFTEQQTQEIFHSIHDYLVSQKILKREFR